MEMLTKILPSLLEGTKNTCWVFLYTLVLSLPLAMIITLVRTVPSKIIEKMIGFYVYVMRGTPLLLQMMFIFFGLPYLGLTLNRETSIMVAFVLNYAAYFAEIFRGGLNAVDSGQTEAATALGLSEFRMFSRILMPQAFRNALPSVGNEILTLIKDTSLINILGASELLKAGKSAVNMYASAVPFIYVGIIYLLLSAVLSILIQKVEVRFNYY